MKANCEKLVKTYRSFLEIKGEFDLLFQMNKEFNFKDNDFRKNALTKIEAVNEALELFDEFMFKNDKYVQQRLNLLQKELKLNIKCESLNGWVHLPVQRRPADWMREFCLLLTHKRTPIVSAELQTKGLDDEKITELSAALQNQNSRVERLNVAFNDISQQGIKELAEALKYSGNKIEELSLWRNFVDDTGVSFLCEHRNYRYRIKFVEARIDESK